MSTTTSNSFPLATEGNSGNYPDSSPESGVDAGASGDSSGSIDIPTGGIIAIVVVVIAVAIIGVSTAVLFYLAKKREWKVRETIRRSARKVANALTPRRAEFPNSVKNSAGSSRPGRRGTADDAPRTMRFQPDDPEKGLVNVEVKGKGRKWGKK